MSRFELVRSFLVLAPLAACVTSSSVSVTGSASVADGESDGAGTVVSYPPGIECTVTAGALTGTCSAAFDEHAVVTLTATPASASSFGGWLNLASGTDFDYEQTLGFQNQALLATNPLLLNVGDDRTLAVLSSFTTN
jgi:hypothetical protein